MRLYPLDVAELFNLVQYGVSVRIVHEPVKAGWRRGDLFVEMHQPLPEYQTPIHKTMEQLAQVISNNTHSYAGLNLDWRLLSNMAKNADGIPTLVASKRKVNLMDVRREIITQAHAESNI
jgi:L,D-transpeptidase ErfK/SrfK